MIKILLYTERLSAIHDMKLAKCKIADITAYENNNSNESQKHDLYTVKPLYYVHTRDPKISLYVLMRSLYLTWFVLNNKVHQESGGKEINSL
jgi:hypothetical protein